MKFLIADDNATNRLVLAAMLEKEGHEVIAAGDGKEAVEAFAREQPDMVVMDVMMPVLSGYEATAQIKAQCGDRFVPVMFLTAVTDEQGLAECIKHGGDDFLTKPFNRVILKSKIDALLRVRDLLTVINKQNLELAAHHRRIQDEQEVARHIFDRMLQGGCLQDPHLQYRLSPTAVLSGDFVLAARRPNGSLHVFVGDMTGHGLSAAVGALPVAQVFYAMTARGYGLGSIVGEVNRKMTQLLPPGMFCAACLLDVDLAKCRLRIWNGGMPDALVWAPNHGILHRLSARHMALGIRSSAEFDPSVESVDLIPGSRLYLFSDGLTETHNPAGEIFGQERLEACLGPTASPEQIFEQIDQQVRTFCQERAPHDDVTLVEVRTVVSREPHASSPETAPSPPASSSVPWHLRFELSAGTLRRIDPLSEITQVLMGFDELRTQQITIFTILGELLGNAVDHGLLGLDSSIRATPDGVSEYFSSRASRLQTLAEGWIRVDLAFQPDGSGNRFRMRIEDSGPGFDWRVSEKALPTNQGFWGRGISMVRAICAELTFHGNGNMVEAVYQWA